MIYENLVKINKKIENDLKVDVNYINGCTVTLSGVPDSTYSVYFINKDTNEVIYNTDICGNCWAKCYFEYFINWRVAVFENGEVIKVVDLDLKDKKVCIVINSHSLGDTLAWFPYIEEFRKKHNCKIVSSTNFNSLFKDSYPDIEFVEYGTEVKDINAQYNISWYYAGNEIDLFKHPIDPKKQPMQKTASDILGLEYEEIKPIIKLPDVKKNNVVTLGIHSTLQAKYWNNPTGWQDVVDYINSIDYIPLLLSKEEDGFMGNHNPKNIMTIPPSDLDRIINELCKSKLFIGTGSGLSWLAWACGVPVILISGFSEQYTEMKDCYRIVAPYEKCSGCFNRYKLNASDWNWCPDHKNTDRQFECSKSISSETIINQIKQTLCK